MRLEARRKKIRERPDMPIARAVRRTCSAALAVLAMSGSAVLAQKNYDVGATDSEIKIGNIMPYSGPLSAYGVIGETETAYFRMINDEGGINGRKINFISYDDAYSPPKTVEQARKLVEGEEVLLIFHALGTPTNVAIHKYMNNKKVPQLFVSSGASIWNDPKNFPWTMGWQPSYRSEARIYAKYLLKEKPDAKIGVFFQHDDSGVDYLKGFKEGLGDKAKSMIVAEESYETSEPTIDTHIVKLKSAGVDVVVNFATPKFAAQAIKKIAEIGWKPMHVMTQVSISVASVMKPAGFENGQGIISATYLKDPTDAQWKDDPGIKRFDTFLAKYAPKANRDDVLVLTGYSAAQSLAHVLKASGDDLTRENIMKQAASMKDVELDGLLPGIKMNTGADDFGPIQDLQLIRFKGESWERFGDVISGRAAAGTN
jgi:branched-chain amino acid transport system substrate-binding protein